MPTFGHIVLQIKTPNELTNIILILSVGHNLKAICADDRLNAMLRILGIGRVAAFVMLTKNCFIFFCFDVSPTFCSVAFQIPTKLKNLNAKRKNPF